MHKTSVHQFTDYPVFNFAIIQIALSFIAR